MKKINKIITIAMCLVLIISIVGCSAPKSNTPATEETTKTVDVGDLKIGVSMVEIAIPFYVAIQKRLEELGEEKGYEVVVLDAQGDVTTQISNMEDLAAQGCDIIFVNTFEKDLLTATVNDLKSQGIPVVAIDTAMSEDAKVLTTVQSNNKQNGIQVGNWIAKQLKGQDIKALLISGDPGSSVSLDRRQGMIEGIIEEQLRQGSTASFEIVGQGYCPGWTEEAAVTLTEDLISLNKSFNLLLSEADVMTMASIKVLKEKNLLSDDIVIAASADGQKEAFEMIKNGEYGATGLNSPTLLAELAVEVAEAYFGGQFEFPTKTYTPAAAITIENVEEYYDPNSAF